MDMLLRSGATLRVDAGDASLVSAYRWHVSSTGYARANIWRDGRTVSLYLHRLIMQTPVGMDTDHINGDRLDNRRENLRVCTRSANMANQYAVRGTSRYRGVSPHRGTGRWHAWIRVAGRKIFIGSYGVEQEAARAYNASAQQHYGERAHLNLL